MSSLCPQPWSVPRLYRDSHVLDICDGALKVSMDDLKNGLEAFSIPIALACDGNRRGELNRSRKVKVSVGVLAQSGVLTGKASCSLTF